MSPYRKRLLTLIAFIPALIVSAACLYMWGMARFEGTERDFWSALEFATETVTTTGYWGDSHWRSPVMVLFVVALQIVGLVLFYMILPMILIPVLEAHFEARLPRRAPKLKQHVVIYRFGPLVESLVEELRRAQTPLVIVELDESVARKLLARKLPVVYADTASSALANVHLAQAGSLVANGADEENATMMVIARQSGFEGDVIALVEEPFHRQPMLLAGATVALTPRHVLGAALAARASHRISPRVAGIQQLGRQLQVGEVPVEPSSALAGTTLAEARVNEAEDVERIHHAGADFALSISQVSGQILASRLLGQEVVAINPQLRVQRATGKPFAGRRTTELDIRERTGCSVVAVERGDELIVELGSDFSFREDDSLYLCGTTSATQRFCEHYG